MSEITVYAGHFRLTEQASVIALRVLPIWAYSGILCARFAFSLPWYRELVFQITKYLRLCDSLHTIRDMHCRHLSGRLVAQLMSVDVTCLPIAISFDWQSSSTYSPRTGQRKAMARQRSLWFMTFVFSPSRLTGPREVSRVSHWKPRSATMRAITDFESPCQGCRSGCFGQSRGTADGIDAVFFA
jgi:hypothetical protein